MAKKRKSRIPKSVKTVVRVFIILFILLVAYVGFHYYRRYAIQSEQIRQAQLQREQEAAKLLRQKKAFIKKIGPIAREVDKSYDLLPSITVAQACLESNYGQSDLSQKYNNLFGVKGTNPNTSAVMTTKEYVKGLKEKSVDELKQDLVAAKKELFNLRFQNATNQLDNTARITEVRKNIARIQTVITQNQRTAE